jgi:hypothetical protein
MMMAVHRRRTPRFAAPRLPAAVYFRFAGWIVWTARALVRAGLLDARGLLAALKAYHLVSRLGMQAWRAERRRLLR